MQGNKTYFISLSKKSIVDAYLLENDEENYENGSRCLDIFPRQIEFFEKGKSEDNPYHEKIQFVQAGNSYGPDVRSSSYSSFDLDSLFSEEKNSDFRGLNFNLSETRLEARKAWAEEHIQKQKPEDFQKAFDEFWEEVQENHLNEDWEFYEDVMEEEDEWAEQHFESNVEAAMSALVDELVDEDKGIVYKIVWED